MKISVDWEKFKYEEAYKISWGLDKNRGGKAFRGPVTEGCRFVSGNTIHYKLSMKGTKWRLNVFVEL